MQVYFQKVGVQFQRNYLSKKGLIDANSTPKSIPLYGYE